MDITKIEIMGKAIKGAGELVSLTDLWKAVGGKNTNHPTMWLKNASTKEFVSKCAETLKVDNSQLLGIRKGKGGGTFAHWQIALAYAKWLSPELHLQVNDVYRRFQAADPAIAESVIDRTENAADLARIEARARNKSTNKELNSTISQHGGTGPIFATVANINNVAITGKTAKQLRAEHNLPAKASTRGVHDTNVMVRMAYAELLESESINNRRCIGNDEITVTVTQVARKIRDLEAAV
jgi:hypothetical protein